MRLLLAAAVAAGVLSTGTVLAQTPRPMRAPPTAALPARIESSSSGTTVVLDVARVFKSHAGFKQRLEAIRRDIDSLERKFGQDRQKIVAEGARLRDFRSGSPEYKRIEERIARELNELRIETVARKNELLEREGKVYFETYGEIYAAVERLAERHNISLVVRYDSDATDEHDRGSILKAINRSVVHQRNLDITTLVIEQVNATNVASVSVESPASRKR